MNNFHLLEKTNNTCIFLSADAWSGRGRCSKPLVPGNCVCLKHSKERCTRCKGQATRECDVPLQFVCGMPLCESCRCQGH